ncbi:hypothetical protein MKW92_005552 [Papaver armeniacum]|nr:hypothetical protein MKW92_005552 [Papaver armeniacum]
MGSRGGSSSSRQNVNSVFYAESYHPIQAGSIDGIDILPHDNAVYRALLCSSAGLYDPFGDPKVTGDPYCSLFVGRLSHLTTEDSLHKAMSRYGRIKSLRLVRDIVTGASRGYAFVEYENDRDMRRSYELPDCEILDYNRQQRMPWESWFFLIEVPIQILFLTQEEDLQAWKGSGQLRFGGRERPFRKSIPFDDLKRLGVPPPPRRRRNSVDREEEQSHSHKRSKHSHRSRRRRSTVGITI